MDWTEYERLKAALPPMEPNEYEKAIKEIAERLGL